ncbi:MAG: tRNA pseudouridine(13) synthase TruD [Nanoarchaeota archaeon]
MLRPQFYKYAEESEPIMYLLKTIPEDFIVTEISALKLKPAGKYLYFKLSKKNWNTLEAVKAIANNLNITEKQIGFAGSKDKQAITLQFCSVSGVSKERLLKVKIDGLKIEVVGYGDIPISLGDLQGNSFEIVVRNLEPRNFERKTKPKIISSLPSVKYIPNYFDEQRFGKNNAAIGKQLLRKDFAEAITLLNLSQCNEYLASRPHDFIGALKLLPLRQLRLYLNAYQSWLWNETLAQYLQKAGTAIGEIPYSQGKFVFSRENFPGLEIPIIGFGTDLMDLEPGLREIIHKIMEKEDISFSDFIIKQIPTLTLEGERRKALVEVQDLKIDPQEEDERHPGKRKVKLSFTLPKGSYATIVVKGMFLDFKIP